MKSMIIAFAALALVACKDEDKPTTTTSSTTTATAAVTTAATTATAAATVTGAAPVAVAVSPEMTGFMAMLDGKDGSARKALKKYGEAAVQSDDLGMYMLQDPKVTKSEKVADQQCYTMQSSAGIMKHTTQLCWDGKNKIAKVTDTSE